MSFSACSRARLPAYLPAHHLLASMLWWWHPSVGERVAESHNTGPYDRVLLQLVLISPRRSGCGSTARPLGKYLVGGLHG
ncbi:hypothetical protein GGR56DRAFT_646493 [Xylariaceae sp. FL0804]|nr:hypothetical protein GGR56DRAFT_646493 [Xylariaceae sp. FL0804]